MAVSIRKIKIIIFSQIKMIFAPLHFSLPFIGECCAKKKKKLFTKMSEAESNQYQWSNFRQYFSAITGIIMNVLKIKFNYNFLCQ